MLGTFGFSYVGLAFLLALFVPNIIWALRARPAGYDASGENRVLRALELAATGQNPPPQAERLQYPICSSAADFKKQKNRLSLVPPDIVDKIEKVQPYQVPYGPESNLFYGSTSWLGQIDTARRTSESDGSPRIRCALRCLPVSR